MLLGKHSKDKAVTMADINCTWLKSKEREFVKQKPNAWEELKETELYKKLMNERNNREV